MICRRQPRRYLRFWWNNRKESEEIFQDRIARGGHDGRPFFGLNNIANTKANAGRGCGSLFASSGRKLNPAGRRDKKSKLFGKMGEVTDEQTPCDICYSPDR